MSDKKKDDDGGGCSCSAGGCGTGSFLAACLSYAINHSFWWAVFHFFCSWLYLGYALIVRIHDVVAYFRNAIG